MLIPGHQIGIHFLYLLCHKAKLRDASGVKLVLVMEGHWLERQDCFAGVANWLDRVLVTLRGNNRTEVALGINDHTHASGNGDSADSCNEAVCLIPCCADADPVSLTCCSTIGADVDIVAAGSYRLACIVSQCDVMAPSSIPREGEVTNRRV